MSKKSMMKIMQITIITFLFIFIVIVLLYSLIQVKEQSYLKKCQQLYSDEIFVIPDKKEDGVSFTCTGLFYDSVNDVFLVGNAGKITPDEEKFQATVEIINSDFTKIIKSIECYSVFDKMRDIQGVCQAADGTVWICSYGENKIRNIDKDGVPIRDFDLESPSGIAFDSRNNTLWILSDKYLYNCTDEGEVIEKIRMRKKGQDQLYLDSDNDIIYISVGADYHGDSYIYTVDLKSKKIKPEYILKDSYAIEGIAILNNKLYVLNDGYYHNAEVPINQLNIYNLNK